MSRQVQQQRRGYAQAVLRALARSQQGRPTPQVQRLLRDALHRWACTSPATLQKLAASIATGRPVELPVGVVSSAAIRYDPAHGPRPAARGSQSA
jgi:hypothetical protein